MHVLSYLNMSLEFHCLSLLLCAHGDEPLITQLVTQRFYYVWFFFVSLLCVTVKFNNLEITFYSFACWCFYSTANHLHFLHD